ncbi:MAG: carbamoyl-phosphate synthase (glutamine-hydrolyzing) large subunit [Planctomycetes bacterium]|nr:carbamoyl-phosphate synthase (glutamine-hydrolyzing) large subunit [Planctomycetota bacterium]
MNKPTKVLILGSSALKIGEAGEFDYSGSQAIKALKEEGIRTVLINPNIATIQTSDHLADQVYFLPVTPEFVEQVIEEEKPDGLLLSFGGQTALNCGLRLEESGVLAKHGVRVLGTPVSTIRDTEDRDLFKQRLAEIGVKTPVSKAVGDVEEAVAFAKEIGFPVMVRIAFALGGLGSGLCRDEAALRQLAGRALSYTNQILVEEYLTGWKEVEYEVVRDRHDNCVTVCNMENFDPLGIHTGESIVVAPSQTLSNSEYHKLREIAIKTIRHLGVVGECNIQYALHPESEDYRVIEVNARLSRSSALASKATGYPLAYVAAKLALGYGMHELPNSITKVTKAFFEPALDYIVVKMPRWDLKKFRGVSRKIGSAMKSVGEVMAIGRTFEEAIQKAVRMLDIGRHGLVANEPYQSSDLDKDLAEPTEERLFSVVEALQRGYSVERVHELTHIDEWFLHKVAHVVEIESRVKAAGSGGLGRDLLLEAKRSGFSDKQVSRLTGESVEGVRRRRHEAGIRPVLRTIDTLGAEFPALTNYLYLTYHGVHDDTALPVDNSVLVLGSGAYRIGCSVEFDWCCVNAVQTLKALGYRTIMLNYNPETVSTDYDVSDRLVFDEISIETVLEVVDKFRPLGVVVSMGGQIPNNVALKLHKAGVKVLGTSPESIDLAEDRHKFSKLLDELDVDQPRWTEARSLEDSLAFAREVGYPVLIRPSYVLSGAAMAVATGDEELTRYLQRAARVSPEHPTVVSKFIENAKEIEFDGVARDGEIVVYAISEHVENAGVHSGDATLVFPAQRMYLETTRQIRAVARRIAERLHINGPFNIQFIAKNNQVQVIECNLRASRSFPFVSKVIKTNFIELATRIIAGAHFEKPDKSVFDLNHVGVKAPQFSFTRLDGADPTLGVEMASTGEVGCIGDDFSEAFLKALLSVGYRLPVRSVLLSLGSVDSKAELLESVRQLQGMGVKMYATNGTAKFLTEAGIGVTRLEWPLSEAQPNCMDVLRGRKVDLVINIPKNNKSEELTNGYMIRRAAVDYNVPLITNRQIAARFIEAISRLKAKELKIKPWSEYTHA